MNQAATPDATFDRRALPAGSREEAWRAGDGHEIRTLELAAPDSEARGSLLFFPGRGDFYEKYLEALWHWRGQGWQVSAADWRGQAMSGRLASDGDTGHVADFSLWVDDLAALYEAWSDQKPGPHVVVAHSMGGHILLRALAEKRIAPSAAVLSAPMLGFLPSRMPAVFTQGMARTMARLRGAETPAWKGSERPGRDPDERLDLLTHDADRYSDEVWWRKERPGLALGPPSWGWIERAVASCRLLERPGLLEAVSTPVLLLATDNDALVAYPPIARAAARLPKGKLVRFGKEARHELLREADPVRGRVMAAIDGFLDETTGAA